MFAMNTPTKKVQSFFYREFGVELTDVHAKSIKRDSVHGFTLISTPESQDDWGYYKGGKVWNTRTGGIEIRNRDGDFHIRIDSEWVSIKEYNRTLGRLAETHYIK